MRGDWLFRHQPDKQAELARNLRQIRGNGPTSAPGQDLAREWFRLAACEAVDVMRLRRDGRPLVRLVEIRGREHLEAALAAGKGAIVYSAHFSSFDCCFSLLGACGFPVTTIGRWQHNYTAGLSRAERQFWDLVYARPLRRHRKHPNIEPWTGRFDVAARAANVLRANEVITIAIDAPVLESDRARAVQVPFLGHQATLLPGAVGLAKATGATVLMGFLRRSANYSHQVLEISPPVPMDGSAATSFARCAAQLSAAISSSPAHWRYWASTADLANLGLISLRPPRSLAAEKLPLLERGLLDGTTPDQVDLPADASP